MFKIYGNYFVTLNEKSMFFITHSNHFWHFNNMIRTTENDNLRINIISCLKIEVI